MAKIYTRTGDCGETSLYGGARTRKSDTRVDLYGEVDELNCTLGVIDAHLAAVSGEPSAALEPLRRDLRAMQSALFEMGALLADSDRCERFAREEAAVPALDVAVLEAGIDRLQADLPPLKTFVLPGGCVAAASLHAARAVCRRLERRAVAASETIAVPDPVLIWLNRLSDWLFTAARWANRSLGVPDVPWTPSG